MHPSPYIIGITGGIGSGKSVVSRLLRLMGVPVYDCDSEAKRLMCENTVIREALICKVGDEVYDAGGNLNRAYLASYMFAAAGRVALVNSIVHPVVRADFKQWAQKAGRSVVAVESAILFEAGMEADVDSVWLVNASEDIRMKRAIKRDVSSEETVRGRMKSQLSEQEFIRRADVIIYNDGDSSLVQQVRESLGRI